MKLIDKMFWVGVIILFVALSLLCVLFGARLNPSEYARGYNQCISEMKDLGVKL